ncbi:MAG: hypothetical protein ACYC5A_03405 [Thermoleophilia bacterium]
MTLHRGLLAAAVYHPHRPEARFRVPAGWQVPASRVLRDAARAGQATMTAVSPAMRLDGDGVMAIGSRTSATPVCRYRRSLHR